MELFALVLVLALGVTLAPTVTTGEAGGGGPTGIARRVAGSFMARDRVWGNYTLDLALEAMLEMDRVTGDREYLPYVQSVMKRRGREPGVTVPWESQPFCHVDYKLYEVTGDTCYVEPFVAETDRYRREVTRSPEGAIAHRPKEPGRHLLIDMLQDYAARMAQAGRLSGDESFFAECAEQHRIYRRLLRDPETGLWRQGRGWLEDPMELSPGTWSRGQGWLIRGMVDSLRALPSDSRHAEELRGYLAELADALVAHQAPDGSWHQLPHLPPEESYPDSTGTGLIYYNLAVALDAGFLGGNRCRRAAERAWARIPDFVTRDGAVLDACPGPGPLRSIEPYLRTPGGREEGESHGPGCIIFACAGRVLSLAARE